MSWEKSKRFPYFPPFIWGHSSVMFVRNLAVQTRGAFHQAFCQWFSLTNFISYWNPCIWLAESKFVSENHWRNAWWNAPQLVTAITLQLCTQKQYQNSFHVWNCNAFVASSWPLWHNWGMSVSFLALMMSINFYYSIILVLNHFLLSSSLFFFYRNFNHICDQTRF